MADPKVREAYLRALDLSQGRKQRNKQEFPDTESDNEADSFIDWDVDGTIVKIDRLNFNDCLEALQPVECKRLLVQLR